MVTTFSPFPDGEQHAMHSPEIQLDFQDEDGSSRQMRFTQPVKVLTAGRIDEVRPLLREVQHAVDRGLYAVGYLSYEAAPAFDPAFKVQADPLMPLVWFGLFERPGHVLEQQQQSGGTYSLSAWQPTISKADYQERIAAIRDAIARGETYQTNYTIRLRSQFSGDDYAFYQQLTRKQRAKYSAYLNLGRFRILSASPELFFHWKADTIRTKPMKGTVKRGRWPEEDRQNAEWLAASEKNKAENVMIVDLLRNDLGTIAEVGSVRVPKLFDIERYQTVFQMTSTVEATPKAGTSVEDIFAALFPCGSITGAPKVHTMGLISQLEAWPREVYCGCIGFIAPDREAMFNVAIRTVLIDTQTGQAEYGVGGGITWDSAAADEYDEIIAKSAILTADPTDFHLLETIKLQRGNYLLLERHLERLGSSAAYFDIPVSIERVRAALADYAQNRFSEIRRVRLLVSQQGDVTVEGVLLPAESTELSLLEPSDDAPQHTALATQPIATGNPFLFHKTTNRDMYHAHKQQYEELFDVLLWNEQGELTEFTFGNLVVEVKGERLTPPVSSGLLAGTLRAELLARGIIKERVLTAAELAQATAIWHINSVRGWVPVKLVTSPSLL